MNPREALQLIAGAIANPGGTWADLGAGEGTFTRALAEVIGPEGRIYAVDRDPGARASLARWAKQATTSVIPVHADFTGTVDLPGLGAETLDGLLFANALHYVPDAAGVLARWVGRLRESGRVVIVEYDGRPANPWVPHPLPFERLHAIAPAAGITAPALVASRPSDYGGHLYVAVAERTTNVAESP